MLSLKDFNVIKINTEKHFCSCLKNQVQVILENA